MTKFVIAFIGAGNMGASLAGGLIADGYDPSLIWMSSPSQAKLEKLKSLLNVNVTTDNKEAVKKADVVVFCVKPQVLKDVCLELSGVIKKAHQLIISIAAGVRESIINQWLGGDAVIVRCMPNTPALIGAGATALFANKKVSEKQHELAESIMRSVGITLWMDAEEKLDAVTALSGSGPAYIFLVIEAMRDAGKKLGLTEKEASLLTLQTAVGASRMALESDSDVKTLREKVTSPGGTTEQALSVFNKNNLKDIFYEAIEAATKRAAELSEVLAEKEGGSDAK